MFSNKSSMTGLIFILFWLFFLVVLILLFSEWHENKYGQKAKIVTNDVENKVILRMNQSNYYHATGEINQVKVSFIVDTGASSVAIPASIAELASLKPLGSIAVQTASGNIQAQMTWIKKLTIGPITLQNIKAIIMPNYSKHVLLGMSALKKLTLKQHKHRLELIQPVSK